MKKTTTQQLQQFAKRAMMALLVVLGIIAGQTSWGQTTTTRFNDGYLTVFKVTSGAALSNTGTAIVTEEYLPTGNQVSPNFSIAVPSGASGVVVSGSATSAGAISRSENGRYILVPGYAGAIGDANTTFTTNGTVRTLNGNGTVGAGIASTVLWFSLSNNLRGATSDDGTNYWLAGGSTGVQYTNTPGSVTTVSTTSTNTRVINIFNGQLFFSTGSATNGIYQVGAGKPTAASTTSTIAAPTTAPYGFSVSPDGLTIYTLGSASTVVRFTYSGTYNSNTFTYSGGSWSVASTGFTLSAVTGVAVDWTGYSFTTGVNGAKVFACNPTTLVTGNDNGTGAITTTTLTTISGNNAFRGLAFSPIKQTVSKGANTPATGNLTKGNNNVVLFQFNVSADEGNSSVKKVVVNNSGNVVSGTDISNYRLLIDANNNGLAEAGEISASLATGTLSGSNITFSFTTTAFGYMSQAASKNLLVIGDVSASATSSRTFIPAIVTTNTINTITYTSNITNAGGSLVTMGTGGNAPTGNTLTIAAATPTITGAATAAAFITTYGTASAVQGFSISGSNLSTSITATAPTGFEVANGAGTYGTTATFTQSGGNASGTLNIRLAATAAVSGTYNSQNIVLSSTGATPVNIVTASSGNTVNRAALTVTADAKSKTYDGATFTAFTSTITGFVNSETVSVVSGAASYSGTATTATAFGSYTITPALNTLTASNYSFTTFTNGTLNINKAALTVTADAKSKTYDGATFTAFTSTITGFVNSETVSVVSGAASYSGTATTATAFGSYTITPALGNLTASNYSFTTFTNGTLNITAQSQSTADFRTKAPGNFSATSGVWEYDQGGNAWADATQAPTNTNKISILHNITLDQDFAVGNSKSLSLDATVTFTINPNKEFSVPAGATANFNAQSVIVASNAGGTGRIGVIAGTLNGASNVTVERYLPVNTASGRTGKAWRLLTAPVTGTTVNAAWQQGMVYNGTSHYVTGSVNATSPTSGYGTLITGGVYASFASANAQGFDWWDAIKNATSSIRTHSGLGTGAWLTPANTTSLNFVNNQGYLLFVRGDRSISTSGVGATTLRATGTLKQGNFSPAILPNGTSTFTLIGNPYASPINFETIYQNNSSKILNRFTIFDANLGLSGGYYLVERLGANNYTITPKPSGSSNTTTTAQFIQSSQAIFVEASTNTANTLSIAETDKATGGNASVFLQNGGGGIDQSVAKGRTSATSLNINLNIKNADNSILLADGAVVRISAAYNKAVTSEDATKTNNIAENLAIGVDNYNLISERRPTLGKTDTVFLKLWGTGIKNYQLDISGTNLKGRTASLIDSYLGTATALNLDGSSNIINFSISSDAASKAINRFYIVTPGSAVTALKTGTLNGQSATNNAGAVSMKAYPNPATGKMVSVLISNLAKGSYSLSAFSSKGQQLFTRTIQHTGGNLTQDIALNNWSAGVYSLQLMNADGAIVKTTSIIVGQ